MAWSVRGACSITHSRAARKNGIGLLKMNECIAVGFGSKSYSTSLHLKIILDMVLPETIIFRDFLLRTVIF
jgi:hypothetical protein